MAMQQILSCWLWGLNVPFWRKGKHLLEKHQPTQQKKDSTVANKVEIAMLRWRERNGRSKSYLWKRLISMSERFTFQSSGGVTAPMLVFQRKLLYQKSVVNAPGQSRCNYYIVLCESGPFRQFEILYNVRGFIFNININ
jgi:hypothetical protein